MSHRPACEDHSSESSGSDQEAMSDNELAAPQTALIRRRHAMPSGVPPPSELPPVIPREIFAVIKPFLQMRHLIFRNAEMAAQFIASLTSWIKSHKKESALIATGVTLSTLSLATPATLGAVGFSATGPVLGSVAAGWQASMGSVVGGSLFSFFQSAAMGGAAMGLITGVGVIGAAIAIPAMLSTLGGSAVIQVVKEKCQEVVKKAVDAVKIVFENVVAKIRDFWHWLWG